MTNNTRFLILPWIRIPHLASFILGASLRRLRQDWMEKYGHELCLVETFVDRSRFAGTCYRAANWYCIGQSKGTEAGKTGITSFRCRSKTSMYTP
jgi:hypothetical protein